MPHLFVNRPRMHSILQKDPTLKHHIIWETMNAIVYKVGGVLFTVGSIFYLPQYSEYGDWGVIMHIIGSILYLIVGGHNLLEVLQYQKKIGKHIRKIRWEVIASITYFLGSLQFTIGGFMFLSSFKWVVLGAWFFIFGSLFFVIGATINVLLIVYEKKIFTLQLMNLTAITFVSGSIVFLIATIPYLWDIESKKDLLVMNTFLAWLFIIGSALFLLGGIFNYWRARIIMNHQMAAIKKA